MTQLAQTPQSLKGRDFFSLPNLVGYLQQRPLGVQVRCTAAKEPGPRPCVWAEVRRKAGLLAHVLSRVTWFPQFLLPVITFTAKPFLQLPDWKTE